MRGRLSGFPGPYRVGKRCLNPRTINGEGPSQPMPAADTYPLTSAQGLGGSFSVDRPRIQASLPYPVWPRKPGQSPAHPRSLIFL
nr:hypothetical protein [Pseudomonas sp.]